MWIGFKIYIGTFIHGYTVVLIRVRIYTLIDPGPDRVPNLVLCDLGQDRLVRVCSVADPGPDKVLDPQCWGSGAKQGSGSIVP